MWRCTSCGRVWRHLVPSPVSNSNPVFGFSWFQAGFPHGSRNKAHRRRGGRPIFTYMLNQSNSESWVERILFQTTLKDQGIKGTFWDLCPFNEQRQGRLQWINTKGALIESDILCCNSVTLYYSSVHITGISLLGPQSVTMETNSKWKNVRHRYYKLSYHRK